jgi:hypothetical protein
VCSSEVLGSNTDSRWTSEKASPTWTESGNTSPLNWRRIPGINCTHGCQLIAERSLFVKHKGNWLWVERSEKHFAKSSSNEDKDHLRIT